MKTLGYCLIILGTILALLSILVLATLGIESDLLFWSDILFWSGLISTLLGWFLAKPFSDGKKEPSRLEN